MVDLVLDESKWLSTAMLLSIVVVVAAARRRRHVASSRRSEVLAAMNLFYGCMIGVMSLGHVLAVTVEAFRGTLEGSPWLLYPIGLVLAVPAWWLVLRGGRRTVALNAWLAVCLLALGPHNWPLALPAALNIAYAFHSRRAVGWTIVTAAIVANSALFIGSLVFAATGQSFEQLEGM